MRETFHEQRTCNKLNKYSKERSLSGDGVGESRSNRGSNMYKGAHGVETTGGKQPVMWSRGEFQEVRRDSGDRNEMMPSFIGHIQAFGLHWAIRKVLGSDRITSPNSGLSRISRRASILAWASCGHLGLRRRDRFCRRSRGRGRGGRGRGPSFHRQHGGVGTAEVGASGPERPRGLVGNAEGAEEPQRTVCAISFRLWGPGCALRPPGLPGMEAVCLLHAWPKSPVTGPLRAPSGASWQTTRLLPRTQHWGDVVGTQGTLRSVLERVLKSVPFSHLSSAHLMQVCSAPATVLGPFHSFSFNLHNNLKRQALLILPNLLTRKLRQ